MPVVEYEIARAILRKVRKSCMAYNRRTKTFPRDLQGMCGIAAARIFHELTMRGHGPGTETDTLIAASDGHAFATANVLVNGQAQRMVLDVTATQFKRPPIVLRPVEYAQHDVDWGSHKFWSHKQTFKSQRELAKWQQEARWPAKQVAL